MALYITMQLARLPKAVYMVSVAQIVCYVVVYNDAAREVPQGSLRLLDELLELAVALLNHIIIFIHTCMCVCIYIYIYTHVYMCVYIYTHTHTCVCIYIYIC